MRIVVSGTHASGKSTLIADFAFRHPEFTVLPDPFELIDDVWDSPSAGMFAAQLRVAANRLLIGKDGEGSGDGDGSRGGEGEGEYLIAERGPIDFLAYIHALAQLTGRPVADDLIERAMALTAEALAHVDVLVVLPLSADQPIRAGDDEYLELREAMNDVLLELVDDPDLIGDRLAVAEITGDPDARLDALEGLAGVSKRRS